MSNTEEKEKKNLKPKWRVEVTADIEIWAKEGAIASNVAPSTFLNDTLRQLIQDVHPNPELGESFKRQSDLVALRVLERGLTRLSVLSEARINAGKRFKRIDGNSDLSDEFKEVSRVQYQKVVDFIEVTAKGWVERERAANT